MAKSLIDRLLDLSMPEPNSGCWLWLSGINGRGYGHITVEGHSFPAHKASYLAHRGPIPNGMLVCHRCDVPLCINPDHLFLGSHRENMADRCRKQRQWRPKGVLHSMAKLTESQVRDIRSDQRMGIEIAAAFNVSKALVSLIRNRKVWSHLD